MNLFQLEYFLTLADTLNYTKASKLLHITQPNLSKMIVNLEGEVGAQLFQRSKRGVRLTPAGDVFYREISEMMGVYRRALERTRDVETGTSGTIDIGYLGTAVVAFLPDIVNRFRRENPDIALTLRDFTYSPLMEKLSTDQIDVAILPDKELDQIHHLAKKYLYADDMCAVVHKEHPLATRGQIDLVELKDESFVMMNPKISIRDYEMVTNMCLEQEFLPRVVYEANTLTNLLMMVECEEGIAILAEHMRHYATENVRFVNLVGYENYFRMVCAWREGRNPSIPQLMAVVDEIMGDSD